MPPKKQKTHIDWIRWVYRVLRRKRLTSEETPLLEELAIFIEEYGDETPLEKWLGFLYLMIGKDQEAERILSRLARIFPHDIEIQNALAYLLLKRKKTDEAVTRLLDALYSEENHPLLKKNLELLRSENLESWLATHSWSDFVFFTLPREGQAPFWENIGSHPLWRFVVPIVMIGVVFFLFFLIYPSLINLAQRYQQMRFRQMGTMVESYSIQDIEKLVEERQKYSIKLTEEEVGKKFEMLKDLIYEGKRNQAIILINELLNSNASEQVKEHVRIFESFVPKPDPKNIDFNPSCRDVLRTPFLYRDVYVNWVGTVANLFFQQRKETSFDLLINFVDEATVEGIATVKMPGFQSELRNGQKVRMFGRIAGIQIDNKVVILDPEIQHLSK
ncbi:tetratricopeptide repeat protein [Thermospira aquatica]|uniref:Tetratricopeptide repeat protein n=1 Tax=Thermospira aquatica TaxID=2828656 RepID=A0AAX3BAR6_9SPIR|nr:tetratricopeptide repeat protein [Thermospira aquatica]URA09304.1 tetratricopeptide repeat protein [Thermospira aquatica]